MRSFRTLVIIFSVLGLTSCGSGDRMTKKKIKEHNNSIDWNKTSGEQIPVDNTQVSTNMRLQISFFSIGAGIDSENKDKYDAWLKNYTKKIQYFETHWGREGEVDYCFNLFELDQKEQAKFVEKTREVLSKSDLVHIDENVPCAHKK